MLDVLTSRRPLSVENARRVTLNVTPQDLRALGFAERGLIPDAELVALADADVPGAETEISLRAWLSKNPKVSREATKPFFAKA